MCYLPLHRRSVSKNLFSAKLIYLFIYLYTYVCVCVYVSIYLPNLPTYLSIQGATERCAQTLGMSSTYQNKKKCSDQHVPQNISFVSYSWKNTPVTYSIVVINFVGDFW
jgi:hypothetical protein